MPIPYESVTELAAKHPNLAEYLAQLEKQLSEADKDKKRIKSETLHYAANCIRSHGSGSQRWLADRFDNESKSIDNAIQPHETPATD